MRIFPPRHRTDSNQSESYVGFGIADTRPPSGVDRSLPCPDLLHARPRNRIDAQRVSPALAIAFTTGGAAGVLDELPLHPVACPRGWETASFRQDLFVDDLVAWLARIVIDGQELGAHRPRLSACISTPAGHQDLSFRHRVFEEIRSSDTLRSEVEASYVAVGRVRRLLSCALYDPGAQVQARQVQMLTAIRDAIDTLASQFAASQTGLKRIREFGQQSRATAPVRRLVDVLEYESRRATIDIRLAVGSDGTIRHFDLVRLDENRKNPFWASPVFALVRKIVLLVLGYRFSEAEVLSRAMDAVFSDLQPLVVRLLELEGDLAFYLAGLRLQDAAHAAGLRVCVPSLQPSGPRSYEALFNPLLVATQVTPVSSCLTIDDSARIVVLTGPNSGGKTRCLEAVGIAQMLGEAGFLVPCAAARLVRASGMLASMGVEMGASHSEGHLGMELLRVRQVFERLPPGGFVLLDELCSGTNPAEAHELFELVLEALGQLNMQAFVSTHFLDLASRLLRNKRPGLAFFQVQVDSNRLPTFCVVPGVAESSLTIETAARLGITRAGLLSLAERGAQRPPCAEVGDTQALLDGSGADDEPAAG
jgi:DNA mismatch repair protein MutS2